MLKSLPKGILYAILATLCWSTVATAFKKTLVYLDGNILEMLFYSNFFSLIILFFILWQQGKFHDLIKKHNSQLHLSLLHGFLNPFLYYLILFKAYNLLPGQVAQPLNYTWPIVLTIFTALFLNQKLKTIHLIALGLSFFGVVVIATQGRMESFQLVNPLGAILALSSSVVWALYWIFNMKDVRDSAVKLFLNFGAGQIYIAIAFLASQPIHWPPLNGLLGTIWIGLFEMGITFFLWMKALEKTQQISIVSNMIYLSPFLSLIFLRFVGKENITLSSFIGLCIIVTSIVIQTTHTK